MSVALSSAGSAVTGASLVTGSVSGQSLVFRDNGSAPDDLANDGIYTASVAAFPSAGSYSLSLTASHPTKGSLSNQQLAFTVIASSVANDNWSQAAVVSGLRLNASSVTATAEPNEPGWSSGFVPRKTLWWRWQPTSSGNFTINTFDSSFDTTLAVFTGSSLSGLTRAASNDDSGGTLQSSLSFAASANTTYYIQVDGYGGSSGNVVLNIVAGSGIVPPSEPPVFIRNPVNATVRPGATVTFAAEASGSPAYQWMKDGVDIPNSARVSGANGPNLVISNAESSDSGIYVCRATNNQNQSSTSTSAILVIEVGAPPSNDKFANRLLLQTGDEVTASTEFASREVGEPDHASGGGNASIWYRWVSSFSGPVSISTSGSSFDTALAVYKGSFVASLAMVAENNDNGFSPQSLVQFVAESGQEYQIAVDGGRPGASGFVSLGIFGGGSGGGDGEVVVPAPDTPVAVPDLGLIQSEIVVSGRPSSSPLSSILIDLNIAHTFRGDLEVALQAPSGEMIMISNRQGGSDDDLLISALPLSSFQFGGGEAFINPNGTWRLFVGDAAGGDEGILNSWALRFAASSSEPPPTQTANSPGRFSGRFGALDAGNGGPSAREQVNLLNGFVTINLSRSGKITGRVLYRGLWQQLRGAIGSTGLGDAVSVARDGSLLNFVLVPVRTASGQTRLGGTVSLAGSSGQFSDAPIQLLPSVDISSQPLRLNVLMRNAGPVQAPVTGDGFAVVRTARGGNFRYVGTMPDGLKFTGAGQILEVVSGSFAATIASALRGGGMLLGQPSVNVAPQYGQAHLQGSVLWTRADGVVNCLTQGVVWEVARGQSLVEGRSSVLLGMRPAGENYSATPVAWLQNNKAFVVYDQLVPMRVGGNSGLFGGSLPSLAQGGSAGSRRYKGILFGRPIFDAGIWLYGGGHLLESGVSSYVAIFALSDNSGGVAATRGR